IFLWATPDENRTFQQDYLFKNRLVDFAHHGVNPKEVFQDAGVYFSRSLRIVERGYLLKSVIIHMDVPFFTRKFRQLYFLEAGNDVLYVFFRQTVNYGKTARIERVVSAESVKILRGKSRGEQIRSPRPDGQSSPFDLVVSIIRAFLVNLRDTFPRLRPRIFLSV